MDSNLYWIGFQMVDRKRRWLCINNELKLEGQDWFNKNTKTIGEYGKLLYEALEEAPFQVNISFN